MRTMYSPSPSPSPSHRKISRSIDTTRTRNALAKPDTGSSSAPLARRRDPPKATRAPGRGGACVRPSPGRVRGRPEWPAHSRPLYFSRLSGATSAQSFGTAPPRFRHPPNPRTEAATVVAIAVGCYYRPAASTVHARPSRTGRPDGALCPARCRPNTPTDVSAITPAATPPPGANQPLAVFYFIFVLSSNASSCTPNLSFGLDFIKGAW